MAELDEKLKEIAKTMAGNRSPSLSTSSINGSNAEKAKHHAEKPAGNLRAVKQRSQGRDIDLIIMPLVPTPHFHAHT